MSRMDSIPSRRREFYVVQFLVLPFEGIDDYECVPANWLVLYRARDQKAVVAYPNDEDPFDTRVRAERKERHRDEWNTYMASVKYESDNYNEAMLWIATRNDYGPLEEEESKINMQPIYTLNRTRSVGPSYDSTPNDNPREPLPGTSGKRPAPSNSKKERHGKRSRPCETQSSNTELGCLKQEHQDIQDYKPLTCAQSVASNGGSTSSQRTDGNLQQLMPAMEVDTPAPVIQSDGEGQRTQISERPSMETNARVPCTNDKPTSHNLLNSLKISAQLSSQINGARRLVPIQRPVEKRLSFMNTVRNLANAAQNPLSSLGRTGSMSSIKAQSSVTENGSRDGLQTPLENSIATRSQEIPHVAKIDVEIPNDGTADEPRNFVQSARNVASASINAPYSSYEDRRSERQQDGQRGSPSQPNSGTIRMKIPLIRQNSTNPPIPLYQTPEPPQQRQSQPDQTDSQRQQQRPKLHMNISIKPKNNMRASLGGDVKKTVPPAIETKLRNLIRSLLTSLNVQKSETGRSESAISNESHLNLIDKECQSEECKTEELLPPPSGPSARTDYESTSGSPIGSIDDERSAGIASGSSADDQTQSRRGLEQQMLDKSAVLLSQMHSTLRATCDMQNNLRNSLLEMSGTYKELFGAVERFNSLAEPEVPPLEVAPATEEMEGSTLASCGNEPGRNVADNTKQKKHNNLWRFVLPPEYDPHDTRWTLKYRQNLPGLVELTPGSGIYVSCGDLNYSLHVSKDCKSLARLLLREVFNRNALSVCITMSERAQASESDNVDPNARPELDDHACTVLLNFVLEHGLKCGWNTDLRPILSALESQMKKIRFKYGVMAQQM